MLAMLARAQACASGSVMERAASSAAVASAPPWSRSPGRGLRARVGDGAGEGFAAGGLAEGCPDRWELGGDVGAAVCELVAVPGQAQGGEQVRAWTGAD